MPVHVVAPGETLSTIAAQYGFSDYKRVYEHPDNQALRKKRPNPNILHPGDEVHIPDVTTKPQSVPKGQTKTVSLKAVPKPKLKLTLLDDAGQPLANMPYVLTVGNVDIEGKSTGGGVVEQEVPAGAKEVTLEIGGMVHVLAMGHLNPLRDTNDGGVSGVQGRLTNLGYRPGSIDGVLGSKTTEAILAFQQDNGLEATGQIDDTLLAALEKAHGS